MDNESIVYGCIKHLPFGDERQRKASCFHNRRALRALPEADEWPFLSQDMFAIAGDPGAGGGFQTQVIHFGMSYRAVEYEWEHWIAKFERLLKRMYWVSAVVHLETEFAGFHTFSGTAPTTTMSPPRSRCGYAASGPGRQRGLNPTRV